MDNIMHKDQNSLKVKQINWQDIERNEEVKIMISIRNEMQQAKGTLLPD